MNDIQRYENIFACFGAFRALRAAALLAARLPPTDPAVQKKKINLTQISIELESKTKSKRILITILSGVTDAVLDVGKRPGDKVRVTQTSGLVRFFLDLELILNFGQMCFLLTSESIADIFVCACCRLMLRLRVPS